MIVASTGVFYDKAWDALLRVAEKNDIAVTESAPMRGIFPTLMPCQLARVWMQFEVPTS